MSALSLLRRPQPVRDTEELDDALPPIASGADQARANLAAKAATVGLLTCLALGPLGAVLGASALLGPDTPAPARPVQTDGDTHERAVAGEFAQRVVLAWLTTTRKDPETLTALVKDAATASLPERPFAVSDATIAGIRPSGPSWSVTVAATVTDDRGQTARRFYQVPVLVVGSAVTALTLPAPVSPPVVAAPPRTTYRNQLGPTSALGTAVTQFLAAYLAGAGDVSRYLTPGINLTALTPPPYTAIRLDDLRGDGDADPDATPRNGEHMRVLATATATVTRAQDLTVAYALSLTARAGRWEITAIDPAPAVAQQNLHATPASSTH